MRFSDLASYLERLEKTSSRIEITKILAELFKNTPSEEIDKVCYLVLGKLAPDYEGLILNIAEKMMLRVLARSFEKDIEEVASLYKKVGDMGAAAFALSHKNKSDLEVNEVYRRLKLVAATSGEGSQEKKVELLASLFNSLSKLSLKFVARIPLGKLRLGFSEKTILDALSWMEKGDKSLKCDLEKGFEVLPDIGFLAKKVKEEGATKAVLNISPVVGIPVLPALAQRLKSSQEMIAKMGKVDVEPKLDGLRVLIHFKRGKFVKAFTRNLNETSAMFPELTDIGHFLKCNSAIFDCEAVGLDEKTKMMANFQTTMTRRRKHNIEGTAKKVKITFNLFDILSKDGKSLMEKNIMERKKILEETVKPSELFKLVNYEITESPERIRALFQEMTRKGYEGIMVKKVDSGYVPGRTGWRWVKMKEEEKVRGQLADTMDLVVMGYTRGKGKRAGFGIGQFLVGVRSKDKIKTVSKIGTGLTDEQFRQLKQRLTKLETKEKPKEYEVTKNYVPDYWVVPSLVVEIAADEITKSPTHTAGLALRFPRLIKFRDDKNLETATNLEEIKNLFKLQK